MLELNLALFKLNCHKALGKNGVSPNTLKIIEFKNGAKLLNYINCWLKDPSYEYPEWLSASLKPLLKKVDLSDPNNWRGILLLDVVSKILSIFINTRIKFLLESRGINFKFRATPKLGFQDAIFVLKIFLQ